MELRRREEIAKQSQSPLVGAFVPAERRLPVSRQPQPVSRNPLWSGHSFRPALMRSAQSLVISRNPLWSGHSFRPKTESPSGALTTGRNPLWSGHSFRQRRKWLTYSEKTWSQSPLVGAFVPARASGVLLYTIEDKEVAIPSGRGIRSGRIPIQRRRLQ